LAVLYAKIEAIIALWHLRNQLNRIIG